jgi:hypothetical protein
VIARDGGADRLEQPGDPTYSDSAGTLLISFTAFVVVGANR